jgi:hypothetical protein
MDATKFSALNYSFPPPPSIVKCINKKLILHRKTITRHPFKKVCLVNCGILFPLLLLLLRVAMDDVISTLEERTHSLLVFVLSVVH